MESQTKQILNHLKRGRSITRLQALLLFGCMELPKRICEVRDWYGVTAKREFIKVKSGKRVMKYWLDKKDILKLKRKLDK